MPKRTSDWIKRRSTAEARQLIQREAGLLGESSYPDEYSSYSIPPDELVDVVAWAFTKGYRLAEEDHAKENT